MVKHRQAWGLVGVGNNPRTQTNPFQTWKATKNSPQHVSIHPILKTTGFTKLIANAKFGLTR